jgi:RNA:NAD 2'-phosphotransferase (TPT1/KptA family)
LQMNQQGHQFFQAKNGVWLTEGVEAEFLQDSPTDSAIT